MLVCIRMNDVCYIGTLNNKLCTLEKLTLEVLFYFLWGLGITMFSVYVENGIGVFGYSYNPKVIGMLIDNFGIFVITLGALLIGITMSKNPYN